MDTIRVERSGHIVTVTIDRPGSPMNAVDDVLHRDMAALFRWLKTVGDARGGTSWKASRILRRC